MRSELCSINAWWIYERKASTFCTLLSYVRILNHLRYLFNTKNIWATGSEMFIFPWIGVPQFWRPQLLRGRSEVKWSRYRTGVAQRVGRGIALLFHDRGTRRGWVVSSAPRPHFTPGKDPVPILQEAGWAPWPVWTGGKSRPHRDSIPDRPARSQSIYRLSYPAHAPR